MTPREKAVELMVKYWKLDVDNQAPIFTKICKQCCLIAVDEILKSNPCQFDDYNYQPNFKYWQKVKEEIELL
jgi:hypothetical protein